MPRKIVIFDTTLRDGEQSPGATMTVPEKLEVADALVTLGVDVIEAGFPAASPGDFEAVRTIAREVHGPVIAGLARAHASDIDRAADAVREAERGSPSRVQATAVPWARSPAIAPRSSSAMPPPGAAASSRWAARRGALSARSGSNAT